MSVCDLSLSISQLTHTEDITVSTMSCNLENVIIAFANSDLAMYIHSVSEIQSYRFGLHVYFASVERV